MDSLPPATDTGTPTTDTGPATDGGGGDCKTCQETKCKMQQDVCKKDMATLMGCNDLVTCINACSDATCANKCISDSKSAEGKALLTCVQNQCATESRRLIL